MMSTSSQRLDQTLEIPYPSTNAAAEKTPETVDRIVNAPGAIPSMLPHALRVFFFGAHQGPLTVLALVASLIYQRFIVMTPLHPVSMHDYGAIFLSMIFWCFQEHFIHGRLLHSELEWVGKDIHRAHHAETYFHISIDPVELLVGWMLAAYLVLRCALPSACTATSATIGYAIAGMWYEWTHYLVHTKVKPRSKFAARVRDGHMKHHLVNEDYWLGFTVPFVDDLFGTNPSVRRARNEMKESRRRKGRGTG